MKYTGNIEITTIQNDDILLKIREKEAELKPHFKLDDLNTLFIIKEIVLKASAQCEILVNNSDNIALTTKPKILKMPIRALRCVTGGVSIGIEYAYGDSYSFEETCFHECDIEGGSEGAVGPQGEPGPIGPKGDTGAQGPIGPIGPKGDTGAQGLKGDTGAQGPIGPKGDTGIQGPKGDTGAQGLKGETGAPGFGTQEQYDAIIARLEALELAIAP